MECMLEQIKSKCNCGYAPCSSKGPFYARTGYHRPKGQLSACFFPVDKAKTYNRSAEYFIKTCQERVGW